MVAALRLTRPVYAINPLAASRYRTRTALSGKKSDRADAVMLANILRTDQHVHRPLPDDTANVQALAVLARAQQDAVWERTDVHNKLRALLKEFYPAMLLVVAGQRGGLLRPEVRTLLAAPTPCDAARLTQRSITLALRRSGRERHLEQHATRIRAVLRAPALRQPPAVEAAIGHHLLALLRRFTLACLNADQLADAVSTALAAHPAADILRSFPGLGDLTAARLLAEVGDDRTRFRKRAGAQGLRRRQPRHPGQRPVPHRARPQGQEPAPSRHWPPLGTTGHSPRLPPHPGPAGTTTDAAPLATNTPPRNDTCSTVSSAACTTA